MAKEASVAPKERVNIVYKPALDAKEEVELPLKLLMVGDYTLRPDDTPLEDRKKINLDKDNFNEVMRKQNLSLSMNVPNKLTGEKGDEMAVNLKFDTLKDFAPDQMVRQVPELAQLMEVRDALKALRGPLGDKKKLRDLLKTVLSDKDKLTALTRELGIPE